MKYMLLFAPLLLSGLAMAEDAPAAAPTARAAQAQADGDARSSLGMSIDMVAADEHPSDVLTTDILRSSRGGRIRPKSASTATL